MKWSCVENATFAMTETSLGIIPGAGGTQRLPRVIGFEKAWTILRTGGVLSGKDALESGLITEIVAPDELAPRVADRAAVLAAQPPAAIPTGGVR